MSVGGDAVGVGMGRLTASSRNEPSARCATRSRCAESRVTDARHTVNCVKVITCRNKKVEWMRIEERQGEDVMAALRDGSKPLRHCSRRQMTVVERGCREKGGVSVDGVCGVRA